MGPRRLETGSQGREEGAAGETESKALVPGPQGWEWVSSPGPTAQNRKAGADHRPKKDPMEVQGSAGSHGLVPQAQALFCLAPSSVQRASQMRNRTGLEPARLACGPRWGRGAGGHRCRCPWDSPHPYPCASPWGPGACHSSTWGGRWHPCHLHRVH